MALSAWQATIVNESGDVIPSASIEVVDEATGLTATIYANAGGGSLGNPFSAGTNGFARFYADAGSYTITASDAGSGFSESFNNVRLGNAQGYDTGTSAGKVPTADLIGDVEITATGTTTSRSLANRFSDVVNLNDEDSLQDALIKSNSTGRLLLHNELSIQILVPSDLPTLQDAVDVGYNILPRVPIEVMIESGYAPVSGISVSNGDYSNITVSSIDSEVFLSVAFTGDFIKGIGSNMPTLNCLVNAGGYCDNGYYLEDGSTGKVNLGCGVTHAGMHGFYANSSSYGVCNGGVFTDCSQASPLYSGILSWGSKVDAYGANVSNSLYYGAQSAASGTLYFRDGVANNCARHNIRATNGAITIARGASALNGGVSGVRSFDMGMVHATDIDVSGSSTGIWCENSSIVNAENVVGDDCTGSFIYCNDMSKVNANNATATDSEGFNIRVDNSSEVVSIGSTLSSVDDSVVRADNNSKVNITDGVISHGGTDAMLDLQTSSECIANGVTSTAALARFATVFNGSKLHFKDGVAAFNGSDGINCSGGSECNVIGSNITSGDVTGMLFNTLYQRGICYG